MPTSHTVRTRDGYTKALIPYTRAKAIKVYCTECLGWDLHPRACTDTQCPLFPFRGQSMVTQRSAAAS